jgi:hypothetical protein
MKRVPLKHFRSFLSFSLLIAVSFGLAGCIATTVNGGASFPDTQLSTSGVPLGSISGSNYGGHAPLVGAHVYAVEPGTSGYGSLVKGVLTAASNTTANGSWTNSGNPSDEFVPAADAAGNKFYGVQTDLTGAFNISGDYTCDPGVPVYLIAYGGAPQYPSGTNTYQISKVVVTGTENPYTYTFTVSSPPELAYVAEGATISGTIAGTTFTSTGTGVIAGSGATALSTTQFSMTSTTGKAGTYTPSGVSVTFNPNYNPAAVNMAMLGLCPAAGNFQKTISYVYMNEISTAAVAYSLAGFVNSSATSQTGNDEFHIGSSGTTQALQGIANAALTANNLYNIQGGPVSSTFAGEGHIANAVTPGGNGTVPQTTLDSIGNTLAACVDSTNTYRITSASGVTPVTFSGTLSNACQTLFQYASDNGVLDNTVYNSSLKTGHQAFNTAQAAFNMANFPQGEGTGTTNSAGVQSVTTLTSASAKNFAAALFNLPTGNVPFSPNLTGTPDSWVVPITYTNNTTTTADLGWFPYRAAIDSQGSIWVATANSATKFSNLGVVQYSPSGVTSGTSLAIDQNDNVWVTSSAGLTTLNGSIQEFDSAGNTLQSALTPAGISGPYSVSIDGSNNVWIGNVNASSIGNTSGNYLLKLSNAGTSISSYQNAAFQSIEGSAIDSTGALWGANYSSSTVVKVPSANNSVTYNVSGGGIAATTRVAIDASDNAWFESSTNNNLVKISSTGAILSGSNGFTVPNGAGTNPEGLGADGAGNMWVGFAGSGASTSALAVFNNAGTYIGNYAFPGQNGTRGAQVDSSGNVWVTEYSNGTLIELVGAATPVVTPISRGVKTGKLGTRP